ncbi:EPM2AIP1 [Cordylochernes scorpioides]|uniref:EPM2AIP1 n=1 Tax=Cordylochernes scorpioides TaxID=51811 RepID=A0ABY6KZC8_9ARAC|nr:EPM2AIP1 [Cordylochernes scorpioides]
MPIVAAVIPFSGKVACKITFNCRNSNFKMVELSELSYYRYCRITVCYLIGRRSGHRIMVELSPSVELGNTTLQGVLEINNPLQQGQPTNPIDQVKPQCIIVVGCVRMSTENGTINGNCSEPSHKVEVLRHKMDKMMEDYHDEMKVLSSQPGGVAPLSSPNHTQCDTCEFTTDGPPTAVCKLRTCDTTDGDDHGRLKEELLKLHKELRLKDAAVERLSHIKDEVQVEVEELTASLFEEAHNMVREANMKQAYSEKLLQEANLKIDMLQAEVAALKTLVLTSTPSAPNRHLHPQLSVASSSSIFQKGHRRSPSNYELSSSPQTTAPQSTAAQVEPVPASPGTSDMAASSNNLEVTCTLRSKVGFISVLLTTWSRMEKKRKIDSECRKFKDQWNIQYFVIESSNKALCLICNESIAVLKEYNMKRHYETKHSQNYSKYTGIVRTEKFEALKRGLKSQQSLFTKVKTEQEAATRASFRVALEIAKRGKPFTDGEMIKECIIAVVEEMCPEKVNLLKTVSMSANTVARRVENIAENISSQLFDKNGHVEWFSLALDESTDVSDTAQVLIYIRGVDKSYEVHEELLDMYSIHGTTTGTDIFKGVEMAINKKNLRWKNLKCITTDGGKNMSGKDKGVVALVSKAVENDGGSKPLVLHCIIHQQSLCGKCLDMSDVLKPVISTVNFIRSFGLNHRQFRQFIAEIGETDLPYHTAVRWLSCGKVLQRFFELRAVIEIFLNEKHRPLTELQNNAWLWKLAFYVDLTKHVNELNLRLQGENQHLPDLYTNIKSFRMKLILFQSQLRSKCFSHFKTCEIFSHTTETEFPIDFAIETLSALKINFDTRFSDFDAIANQIKIFQNPFDADIETLAPELQMEMIDLQCSDIIKNKYENSSLLEFYKCLPLTQFDNLHKFARGLFSVFGTTYLCEKTFSKMKYTKNVYRSKLTDEHFKSLLIIGTSKISPQLQTIVGGKSQLHTSH